MPPHYNYFPAKVPYQPTPCNVSQISKKSPSSSTRSYQGEYYFPLNYNYSLPRQIPDRSNSSFLTRRQISRQQINSQIERDDRQTPYQQLPNRSILGDDLESSPREPEFEDPMDIGEDDNPLSLGQPLPNSIIDTFPVIKFRTGSYLAARCCSVCQIDFKSDEQIRLLCCFDYFHKDCIDEWFRHSNRCPNCNHDFLQH